MPVRNWSPTSEIHIPVAAGYDTTADFSMACLIKPHAFTTDNHIIMAGVTSAGVVSWQFGIRVNGKPYFQYRQSSGFPSSAFSLDQTLELEEWQIVGFSGPGISDFRKFHVRDSAGVWTHSQGDAIGVFGPVASIAGGWIILGRELNAAMAVAALWDYTITDTPFEAIGENDASLDWTTFTFPPVLALNFDQTTPTEQIPDLLGNHETISGTLTDPDTDPNGITGTTIIASTDLTWDFTVPPPPLDFFLRFSGGASNADPLLSHGGVESSVVASNLIPNFPRIQAVPGVTYYSCVYVHNGDDSSAADVEAYFSNIALSTGVHVAMGVATEVAGSTVAATANSNTAPSGVSFSTPTTEGAALNLGAVDPGEGKGIWVRVILDPGSPGAIHNSIEITFNITPL